MWGININDFYTGININQRVQYWHANQNTKEWERWNTTPIFQIEAMTLWLVFLFILDIITVGSISVKLQEGRFSQTQTGLQCIRRKKNRLISKGTN